MYVTGLLDSMFPDEYVKEILRYIYCHQVLLRIPHSNNVWPKNAFIQIGDILYLIPNQFCSIKLDLFKFIKWYQTYPKYVSGHPLWTTRATLKMSKVWESVLITVSNLMRYGMKMCLKARDISHCIRHVNKSELSVTLV